MVDGVGLCWVGGSERKPGRTVIREGREWPAVK